LYWRAVRTFRLPEVAGKVAARYGARRVGIFGEVFGKGVQDLAYGADAGLALGYAVFDVSVDVDGAVRWLDPAEMREVLTDVAPDLPLVPQLYAGPYDEALLLDLATGRETVSGTAAHLREGIVVRSAVEHRNDAVGSRTIGKMVSADYLTRKGGTEYE
jgi:RNA ligase (TIGR02306 family)